MTEQQESIIKKWRDILAKGYPRGVPIENVVPPDPGDATFGQVIGGRP